VLTARLYEGSLCNPYRGVSRFPCHGRFRQKSWAEILNGDAVEIAHNGFGPLPGSVATLVLRPVVGTGRKSARFAVARGGWHTPTTPSAGHHSLVAP
jgi:hypothetical protein